MKTIPLLILLSPLLSAGNWSTADWTGDSSSDISTEKTVWVYHFGSTTATEVNGVAVTGINGGNPSAAGDFTITGVNFVYNIHSNDLTALTGTGSSVIAHDFIYGGAPAIVTLSGLRLGASYTASFFGVGFNAPDERTSSFGGDMDALTVDENALGTGKGIRVDYAFTATMALIHCTLSANTAGGFGGGAIYNSSNLALNHSIAAGNTPDNVTGTAFTGTENFTSGDPLLAPLANHGGPTSTMLPLTSSPAINAATTSTSPLDQRGVRREGIPDIGAAEFQE